MGNVCEISCKFRLKKSAHLLLMNFLSITNRLPMMSNSLSVRTADRDSRNNYLNILNEAWQRHLAPRAENAPTVVSLFAGCGGSSLGYSMAGYRELPAVEWNNNAVETFR